MNLVNCAMFSAFLLTLPTLPDVDAATEYYKKSMMTGLMEWFCRQSGKSQYSPSDIRGMQETAALRAGDRNPYSWNMDFREYEDGSGYEAKFYTCGICTLMTELGLKQLIPAMIEQNKDIYMMDMYAYLVKIRCYLQMGKYLVAHVLVKQLITLLTPVKRHKDL